jgi:excisionase family DNA binding protein
MSLDEAIAVAVARAVSTEVRHIGERLERIERAVGAGKLLSVRQAASLCGCSEATIRRQVASGEMRYTRVGSLIRIDPSDLAALNPERAA